MRMLFRDASALTQGTSILKPYTRTQFQGTETQEQSIGTLKPGTGTQDKNTIYGLPSTLCSHPDTLQGATSTPHSLADSATSSANRLRGTVTGVNQIKGALHHREAAAEPKRNMFRGAGKNITYSVEAQFTAANGHSPLWLNANRYGLSSTDRQNGYLRASLIRSPQSDSLRHWRLGYGIDAAVAYGFTSTIVLQQLYADFDFKKIRIAVGSKERPAAMKNMELSSGSQTLGINARPIPEVRFELPDYVSITGRSDWAAIKGHVGYGFMTDGRWQESYVGTDSQGRKLHYAKGALYHSKAGYLRLGNAAKFPLVFEGGLEMACTFGGTIYNPVGRDGIYGNQLKMGHGPKDFINALFGRGGDATDEEYTNAAGNTTGSWLLSLLYQGKGWSIRAYYDHYFEDHSMMFLQYGWRDGLKGVELTLPRNPFVTSVVYEHLNTTYQSGPIYHDHTEALPDQISGVDNYYNHNLYQGWQHWGQAIGNPLFTSPLYNGNGDLTFTGNRFKAHHFGLSGDPIPGLHYRLLYSYMSNWGRYAAPYPDVRYNNSFLCEATYTPARLSRRASRGWSFGAAFALDRGAQIGDNTGFQLTLRKTGLLTR